MDTSIEKFKKYLENAKQNIVANATGKFLENYYNSDYKVESKNNDLFEKFNKVYEDTDLESHELFLNNTIDLEKFLENGTGIYGELKYLNVCLGISGLNARDKMNVINYVIQKNIENGILDIRDEKGIIKLGSCSILADPKMIDNIIDIYNFLVFVERDDEHQDIFLDYKEIIRDSKESGNCIINQHRVIKEKFLDKKDDFTKDNIIIYTDALYELGFSEENVESISCYLNKCLAKKEEANKTIIVKTRREDQANLLSVKEQNKIYREIMSMYNIDLERAVKPLNLDEIIYLVSLMYKLKISETKIRTAIKNIYKSYNVSYENPLAEFNAYYEKMVYLSENEDIKAALSYMQEIVQEIHICDNKSYIEWNDELKNTMASVKPILSLNIEFELEQGKHRTEGQNEQISYKI
jgi:hypothetical protein